MVYVVMGVSGCGKTTIGKLLAERLHIPFFDGDDYHPPTNVAKMRNHRPLTDSDRQAWLETLARKIDEWQNTGGAVLACSALKRMPATLLDSQFQTLEEPVDAIVASIDHTPREICDFIITELSEGGDR